MRIVAGIYKSRVFPGTIPPGIRPTTDRVRESIFNILTNFLDFDDIRAADICAGSGALGFEALSRGTIHCTFFEKSRKTAEYIKKTAESFKITGRDFAIIVGDALGSIEKMSLAGNDRFGLVFVDPPYLLNLNAQIMEALHKGSLLADGCIIASESSIASSFILPEEFRILTERAFGTTKVVFYEYNVTDS